MMKNKRMTIIEKQRFKADWWKLLTAFEIAARGAFEIRRCLGATVLDIKQFWSVGTDNAFVSPNLIALDFTRPLELVENV